MGWGGGGGNEGCSRVGSQRVLRGAVTTFSFLFGRRLGLKGVSLVAQAVKNLPAMQEIQL